MSMKETRGTDTEGERLQKVIANAGVTSRRNAEIMIEERRVKVNGKIINQLGYKVKRSDKIEVDGTALSLQGKKHVYILLYKPIRTVTTAYDPQGRKTVLDCIQGVQERLFPIGRLDYLTSGALVLTNDGELANRLMHPSFGVTKTYEAIVEGEVSESAKRQLEKGVRMEGRLTAPAKVSILGTDGQTTKLTISIHEGRNRQVRNMLELVEHPCIKLTRTHYSSLNLRGLRPGQWRMLSSWEIDQLKQQVGMDGSYRTSR
ncbi:Ribosomal large subunit pseudouridine synthase B [Acidibacillus sp. S0AB]|uniref:Pseudouridine synthase n=2 Tax=Sulfoacidibacillus ferrooxidans TaxID=2005001 RepID=A0A9X1VA63_9BACL|nr:Ribosomal large subunit pseudouridine synthase B [Sulfoacidibacillus ferrooxidans]